MKVALSKKNLWEKLPPPLKIAVGRVLSAIPIPYLLGRKFREQMKFLDSAQWWSADKSREYQLCQLKRICTLAYERTPYYRKVFDDAHFDSRHMVVPEDIERIPTIDRSTIESHLDELCAISPNAPNVDFITTGGTSGQPLRFYIGAERSQIEFAYLVKGWERAKYSLGTPMAVFRGRVVHQGRADFPYEFDPLFRNHFYSNFHMTPDNISKYLRHVEGIGPCFLHVYPSSAAALASHLRREGEFGPENVMGVLAESENVYPDQRRVVEDTFRCRYFSSYGHTEKLVSAAECEHSTDYHVWPTYGYFELLDEDGKNISTPGKIGEIVGTGFINSVVPFIRYRTGDYATYIGTRCDKCGREQQIIRNLHGHRIQETLVTKSGSRISWSALNMHDDTFHNVERIQYFQETPGRAILKIIPAAKFSGEDKERILGKLNRKLDGQIFVEIVTVDSIKISKSGKVIYVDQRIKE